MCRCVSCDREMPRTRQFKKIIVPHKKNPDHVTKITLDGTNHLYPQIVEEDMCSRCQSSTGSIYCEYETNDFSESEWDILQEIALVMDIPFNRESEY